MRQFPNTQLKTLVKAIHLIYAASLHSSRQMGFGLVVFGAALPSFAEPVPLPASKTTQAASSIDTLPNNSTSNDLSNNNQAINEGNNISSNVSNNASIVTPLQPDELSAQSPFPKNANELESAAFNEPIELAPVDINSLMQQAETAKQTASIEITRITKPATTAQVADNVVEATQNEVITSSISNGISENLPNVAVVDTPANSGLDNPATAVRQADTELKQAKEQTQISAENADIVQKKEVNTGIKNTTDTTQAAEKPGFFKRIWRRFRPLESDAGAPELIRVTVVGAPENLQQNIDAKLSQYTVEAFSDFRASLPQLRSMSRDAAEAVGYYNAEFRFEQAAANALQVRVTPNQPVLVNSQDIRYEGAANQDNTFTDIQKDPDLKVGDQMNDQLYEQTKTRISSAATEKGYFDGYWIMHDVQVNLPDNKADINLAYASGERYKLGGVEFKSADPDKPIPLRENLLRQLVPFDENDDYGSWKVNNLSRNLSDTRYFNSVQVDVVIPDPIVKPVQLPASADVDQLNMLQRQSLAINNESPVATKNNQANTSNARVDESQFAGTKNNEEMPVEKSEDAQQALTEAEIKEAERKKLAAQVRETRVIPVVVTINTDKPNSAEVGIGYGTDTKVRLRSQYRKALVNDRGHSLDSNLELSKIRQAVDGRYTIPYKHPLEDVISLFGGYEIEERSDIGNKLGLKTDTATVGIERAIKPRTGQWQHTISARYRNDQLKRESNDVDQDELPPPFNIQNSRFEQQSLLFGYGASKTKTVGRLDPTRAFRQFYQVDVGSKSLLSDADMAILRAGFRFIYSFGEDNVHQVVGRADAATILTKDNFDDVPYNLRFFAGGDQSIRGYDYKSLSTERNGYLIGGQNLAVGSLEYNYMFKPKWRGAVFVDAGNAFDKNFTDPVKIGAGLGVRWSSPVGPIRVDVGAGVSEKNIPVRLHFFIGPQL